MLRKGPIVFLTAAVLLAGLAAWGAHRWITTQAEQAAAKRVVTAPVVVASQDLEPGQKLEAKHLLVLNWPAGSLPAGHFARAAQVQGRVLKSSVVKGELMVAGKLAQEGLAGGLSAVVPRAFGPSPCGWTKWWEWPASCSPATGWTYWPPWPRETSPRTPPRG
jgi:pilus assembly protein CpaB